MPTINMKMFKEHIPVQHPDTHRWHLVYASGRPGDGARDARSFPSRCGLTFDGAWLEPFDGTPGDDRCRRCFGRKDYSSS